MKYKIYEKTYKSLEDLQYSIINQIDDFENMRDVKRPDTPIMRSVLSLLLKALITAVIVTSVYLLPIPKSTAIIVSILSIIVFFLINIRKLMLTLIIIYQKYAPERIRSACLFKPCCSEHMKCSIEKYGTLKGFIKGIKRILRCRYPNGGIDEP
ncbi:MAG: membrane protein insertion efficiency factor YidD [Clostridium sp.]|nr:membrane protein insertion efficiency factor YidD [Clostridium sp.]